MKQSPLVSVLMPAYNAERFISEAISSILSQDYEHLELLILDDASTDDTLSIIKSFHDSRIKLFQHIKNQGYLVSCNELFEKANGDFITFQDADDTCGTSRISSCLEVFKGNETVDFLTTGYTKTNALGEVISSHNQNVYYNKYATDYNYYPTICCATAIVKSALLKQVGGYNNFFKAIGGEDYHWIFRLACNGVGLHLAESTYHYRQHENQTHIKNDNKLSYFFDDIDKEIRKHLLDGKDELDTPNLFLQKWKLFIEFNPALVSLKQASASLNYRQPKRFVRHLANALLQKPHNVRKLKQTGYLVYSFFTRIS